MRFRFLLFGALMLALMGVSGGNASARPQEGLRVAPNEPAEAEYGAMGPGCPGCSGRTGATEFTPVGCAATYQTFCDNIPLEIVPPTGLADDRDIFFTIVELHWDDSAGNDLDLNFYDTGQSTGTAEKLGASESTKNPEVVRVANADLEQYQIVVFNYSGANTGYTLKVRISLDPFTSPTEAVAPEPPKTDEPADDEEPEFEAPEDLSGDPSSTPAAPSDPTLPPVEGAIGGDEDFNFGFSDLDDRISVNQEDFAAGSGTAPPAKKQPVNPAVLLASLVGAPAVVVGSGAAFAWKRRRELLV